MNSPVVLVTGALTGIGRATALAFAKTGARVAVSGRRVAEGQVLERELQQLGGDAAFFAADVRDDEEVRELVDRIVIQRDHEHPVPDRSASTGRASNPPHINPT